MACIGVGSAAATYTHLGGDVKNRWLDCVWAWARLAGVAWVDGDAKKVGHSISGSFYKKKHEFKSTFQERTVGVVGDMAWTETDSRQKCVSSTQQVIPL